MQIFGDNLLGISKPVFWKKYEKKNVINVSSAELDKKVVKVKG